MVISEETIEVIGDAITRTMAFHGKVDPFMVGQLTHAVAEALELSGVAIPPLRPLNDGDGVARS